MERLELFHRKKREEDDEDCPKYVLDDVCEARMKTMWMAIIFAFGTTLLNVLGIILQYVRH